MSEKAENTSKNRCVPPCLLESMNANLSLEAWRETKILLLYFHLMFWFDADKYDFWPVYAAIQKYYPIGIPKEEVYVQFYSTSPQQQLRNEAFDNHHVYEKENGQWLPHPEWQNCVTALQHTVPNQVEDITYPQAPCFSAYVEVARTEVGDVIRKKELLVFISFLGPFYTVIGQNKTALATAPPINKPIADSKSWRHHPDGFYPVMHHLVISPWEDFEEAFVMICKTVEQSFPGFRFVPFSICNATIAGLEVPQAEEKPASVFQALFSGHYFANFKAPAIGDARFKEDDWISKGYVEKPQGKWHAFPSDWSDEQRNEAIEKLNQAD